MSSFLGLPAACSAGRRRKRPDLETMGMDRCCLFSNSPQGQPVSPTIGTRTNAVSRRCCRSSWLIQVQCGSNGRSGVKTQPETLCLFWH